MAAKLYTYILTHRQQIRDWIISEDTIANTGRSEDRSRDNLRADQLDSLSYLYRKLAETETTPFAPTPDMLLQLGWAGGLIYWLCYQTGVWRQFRREVERRYPEIPAVTSLVEQGKRLHSINERVVTRAVLRLSGIKEIHLHPQIPCSNMFGDLLVVAVTGKQIYIEVAMPARDEADDSSVERAYRSKLNIKQHHYANMNLALVTIWADEMGPRALAARMNEVLEALGLPLRPSLPVQWYEEFINGSDQ